jgi:pimeloyl-ACP methyl ester carboxylesterase
MPHFLVRLRRKQVVLLLGCLISCSRPGKQIVPVNSVLPSPPPSAPMSHWIATQTREPESMNTSGAVLLGWTFLASANTHQKARILFFNGNAMNIDDSQAIYRELCVRGADVTVFDYRGYGFSTGKADVINFREDALALYDRLASSGPVVVYGFSIGTALATYVASERRVAGLILAGAIANANEEFPVFARAQGYSKSSIAIMTPSPEAVTAFNEVAMISRNNAPLLMLHGEADQLVPIQQGREVFAASSSRQKQFVTVAGAGHNDTVESTVAMDAVRSFLFSIQPDSGYRTK